MKAIGKTIQGVVVGLILAVNLLLAPRLAAQTMSQDSIVQLTADENGLPLVLPEDVPGISFASVFWGIGPGAFTAAPFPCIPPGDNPVYALDANAGVYLADLTAGQTNVTETMLEAQAAAVVQLIDQVQAAQTADASPQLPGRPHPMDGGLEPPGDGDGTNSYGADVGTNYPPVDYGTNLYIARENISAGYLEGIASNTLADVPYEVQSVTNLAGTTNWVTQGFILGSETTNWTPLNPLPASRTNNLFIRLKSWQSSDSSGLPDWWELEYFGHLDVDPNALDFAGDGYTIYQKFVLGINPNAWLTPLAPQNLACSYNLNTATETISWSPSPGATSYTLNETNLQTGAVTSYALSATNTSFVMGLAAGTPDFDVPPYGPQIDVVYGLRANYGTNGSSLFSSQYAEGNPAPSAQLVNGADGRLCYIFQGLPADLSAVRIYRSSQSVILFWIDWYNVVSPFAQDDLLNAITDTPIADGYFEIPASAITNGLCELPDSDVPPFFAYNFWVQTVRSNGVDSAWTASNPDQPLLYSASKPFLDARRQLKDNLTFLLRAADDSGPFNYIVNDGGEYATLEQLTAPSYSYVYADFYNSIYGFEPLSEINELQPFHENYFFRNFCFNPDNLDTDGFPHGVSPNPETSDSYDLTVIITNYPPYFFNAASFITGDNFTPPASQLSPSMAQCILPGDAVIQPFGSSTTFGGQNCYGLACDSEEAVWETNGIMYSGLFSLGDTFPPGTGVGYYNCAQPGLQPAGYYFARPESDPMPEESAFAPSGTQPVMFAGVGSSMTVAGYSILTVTNGYSGIYACLGQYFAGACQINASGAVITNSAGVLSHYGVFTPTVPGPAALVTMPDIDSGEQGTCTVYAVSLQLDANHDGIMDLSFNGADATSAVNPMQFWCNNNFDRYVRDPDDDTFYDDDVAPNTDAAMSPGAPGVPTPDCNFLDGGGNRVISCARDLEDFSRLWVCGVTSNLLAELPSGTTVTLSWDGSMPGAPTIDLFAAADADGGTGYLTNSTSAEVQLLAPYVGRLGPGQSIQLNASTFANHWAGNHFIWCGVSNGTGALNLTINEGTGTLLVQTTAYIQIQDIKQMYERWTIGEQMAVAPLTNAVLGTEDLPVGVPAFQYPLTQDTNTPYILYVHGWNMNSYDKDRFAETAFKRLYWQGYQGRFGVFRWPTGFDFTGGFMDALFQPHNFDGSEYNAWESAAGLVNKLKELNAEYPGHVYLLAHSMGNVVAGEALRQAAQNGDGQLVNTYVASQAAIPAHIYDASVTSPYLINFDYTSSKIPNYLYWQTLASYGPTTPNIYGNRLTNNAAAVGRRISFYNANDFALSRDSWCFDQELKPDVFLGNGYYYYAGGTNDEAPWNHFEFVFTAGTPTISYDIVTNLNDCHAVLAYASEPRSTALGATPIITFDQILNLTAVWPPDASGHDYADHFWHSAQFRGDCWQEWNYWNTLLRSGSEGFNVQNP